MTFQSEKRYASLSGTAGVGYDAGYDGDYPPAAYIATTEPVYVEGRPAYDGALPASCRGSTAAPKLRAGLAWSNRTSASRRRMASLEARSSDDQAS